MKEIIMGINQKKERVLYAQEKIAEIKKIIKECKSGDDLICDALLIYDEIDFKLLTEIKIKAGNEVKSLRELELEQKRGFLKEVIDAFVGLSK